MLHHIDIACVFGPRSSTVARNPLSRTELLGSWPIISARSPRIEAHESLLLHLLHTKVLQVTHHCLTGANWRDRGALAFLLLLKTHDNSCSALSFLIPSSPLYQAIESRTTVASLEHWYSSSLRSLLLVQQDLLLGLLITTRSMWQRQVCVASRVAAFCVLPCFSISDSGCDCLWGIRIFLHQIFGCNIRHAIECTNWVLIGWVFVLALIFD